MSEVIRINKKLTNISTQNTGSATFITSEEQEKENLQTALHNQYVKGFDEGKYSAKEELEKNYSDKLSKKYTELNSVIESLKDKFLQIDQQFEKIVTEVSFIISKIILKREIDKESIIKDVLDESLKKVIGANEIIIRLHPDDYKLVVKEGEAFSMKNSFSHIKFEKDERIEPGGCFIESEIGNADGRISSQLNELKKKLERE